MVLAVDPGRLDELRQEIEGFVRGDRPLSGLDLYYRLEKATDLAAFHLVLRHGPKNRMQSGLQQSYGDHNRLLLLGLDRLCAGDLDWFRGRLDDPGTVDDARLLACFDAVRNVGLGPAECVALWVGAALHDCGMLSGRATGVDVEDGVVLAGGIIGELCRRDLVALALFAVRNHDYVKDIFRGEVPVAFVRRQVEALSPDLRAAAITALGMIQVAGAASLGEGRLTPFRLAIFEQCVSGAVLTDEVASTRLARLLGDGAEDTAAPESDADVPPHWQPFLDRVCMHRWHSAWSAMNGWSGADKSAALEVIVTIADRTDADHVVLEPSSAPGIGWQPDYNVESLGNGTIGAFLR